MKKHAYLTVANNNAGPRILDRLAGLETEYAIRFRPRDSDATPPTKFRLYQAITDQLRRRVLTVAAAHFKDGLFSANGGAVWFESEQPCGGAGLVEGSTPECRGARRLLAYQRAQDELLGEATRAAVVAGEVSLLKNDRDAFGNIYGAQENYEATLASGWRLWCWRVGMVAILPLAVLTWLGLLSLLVLTLVYFFVAGAIYFFSPATWKQSPRFVRLLLGEDWVDGKQSGRPSPRWMEVGLLVLARIVTFPLAAALFVLLRCIAFAKTRQQLLPFLLSRAVFAGAGTVTAQNEFQLADKALGINCVHGFGGVVFDRPIFNFGHLFKTLCVEAPFALRDLSELFQRRQRLQIGLGDSNMCEVAEFLKVGATMLVLDVIEAGEMPPVPKFRRPIQTLRTFCGDSSLQATAPHSSGSATALETQWFYYRACRDFVFRHPEAPDEASEILLIWRIVLDRLENQHDKLIGILDWVTKQHLLDEAKDQHDWQVRKKIDLRYHELSPDGYFQMLRAAGTTKQLIGKKTLAQAMRTPPPDTPATMRGHYIREFAAGLEPVTANWRRITIGHGRHAKIIRLSRYSRRASSADPESPDASHSRSNS